MHSCPNTFDIGCWCASQIPIISVLFWVTPIFDYLHFAFFIAWIALQLLTVLLLWKYRQLLLMVYGFNDDGEEEPAKELEEVEVPLDTLPSPSQDIQPQQSHSNGNVNVTVNLTMPSQQPQQPMMPMQPMQPMYPMNGMMP